TADLSGTAKDHYGEILLHKEDLHLEMDAIAPFIPRGKQRHAQVRIAASQELEADSCSLLAAPCSLNSRDPRVDALPQYVEGQCASVQHLIVEGADVELRAQRFLCAIAEVENLQLSDLVSECLAGPRDVAIHFGLHAGFVHIGVVVEVLDHLLAGPGLAVDAGVDYQADGAPDVGFKSAVIGVGVLVKADVFAQPL